MRKTEITLQPIPNDSEMYKWVGEKRNKIMESLKDQNVSNEIQIRKKLKEEDDFKLGIVMGQLTKLNEEYKKLIQTVYKQNWYIALLEEVEARNVNFITFLEEERYGKLPIVEVEEVINDTIFEAYVKRKYNNQTWDEVKKILDGQELQ